MTAREFIRRRTVRDCFSEGFHAEFRVHKLVSLVVRIVFSSKQIILKIFLFYFSRLLSLSLIRYCVVLSASSSPVAALRETLALLLRTFFSRYYYYSLTTPFPAVVRLPGVLFCFSFPPLFLIRFFFIFLFTDVTFVVHDHRYDVTHTAVSLSTGIACGGGIKTPALIMQ